MNKFIRNFFNRTKSLPQIIGAKFYYRPESLSFEIVKNWIEESSDFITPLTFGWEQPFTMDWFKGWTMETLHKKTINIEGENIGTGRIRDTEHFWVKDFHNYHSKSAGVYIQFYFRFQFDEDKIELFEKFPPIAEVSKLRLFYFARLLTCVRSAYFSKRY